MFSVTSKNMSCDKVFNGVSKGYHILSFCTCFIYVSFAFQFSKSGRCLLWLSDEVNYFIYIPLCCSGKLDQPISASQLYTPLQEPLWIGVGSVGSNRQHYFA